MPKHHRIRMKMILAVFVFAVIPAILMSIIYYNAVWDSETERIAEYMRNNIHNTSDNIEINLLNIEQSLPGVISDEGLIDSLRLLEREEGGIELRDASKFVDNYLFELNRVSGFISNIYISNDAVGVVYAAKGKRIFFPSEYAERSLYRNAPEDYEHSNQWIITQGIGKGNNILALYKEIREFTKNEHVGTLTFLVDEEKLRQEIELKNDYDADIFILDAQNNYVSHPDEEITGTKASDGKTVPRGHGFYISTGEDGDLLTVHYESGYTGWRYVSQIPIHSILSTLDIFRNYTFTIIVLMILLMIGWSIYNSKVLYEPIKCLMHYMQKMEKNDFESRIPFRRDDEFGYLYDRYNEIAENVQKLINDLYIQRILRQQAQLNAIETEINEHFLYNTLDAARWMIRMGKEEEASDLLLKLSQLFRQSLDTHEDIATVSQVMELLQNYLDIIKIRYKDQFECRFQFDEGLAERRVLKFIFQPLVENAVFHGMKGVRRKLEVEVSFVEHDDLLVFSVWDNGSGISPERMSEIRVALDSGIGDMEEGDCFALKNINAQIKLFYGKEYGLRVEGEEYKWTRVSFEIPKEPPQKGKI
ncbi:MAG TPA: histidine kinase [Clostridiaceae bacterium]|nr:histidine kinase [Clostridiaceae bacterium]